MASERHRAALGQIASLGTLYDARHDVFLPLSIAQGDIPSDVIQTEELSSHDLQITDTDSIPERFEKIGVDPDLAASILAEMVSLSGSSSYLTTKQYHGLAAMATLYYTATTSGEKLALFSPSLLAKLNRTALEHDAATHVVVGITRGSRTIISAHLEISHKDHQSFCQTLLKTQLGELASHLRTDSTSTAPTTYGAGAEDTLANSGKTTFTIYSDLLQQHNGTSSFSCASTINILKENTANFTSGHDGKGNPLFFSLLPLELIFYAVSFTSPPRTGPTVTGLPLIESFIQLFSDWDDLIQRLEGLCKGSDSADPSIGENKQQASHLRRQLGDALLQRRELAQEFKQAVAQARAGQLPSDKWAQLLQSFPCRELHEETASEPAAEQEPQPNVIGNDLDEFENAVEQSGGYLLRKSQVEEAVRQGHELYVFWYDDATRQDVSSWEANKAFILDLLTTRNFGDAVVGVCDCTAERDPLSRMRITHYKDMRQITADVVQAEQELARKCLAQHQADQLDTSEAPPPTDRRPVQVTCPSRKCDKGKPRDWFCATCEDRLEYAEGHMYCKCGRAPCNAFKYKCSSATHGDNFIKYPVNVLKKHLENLSEYKELNILILGETGVGKSTFINAFINYLMFETLEEAMDHENLEYLVPCSFSMQYVDDQQPDAPFIQRDIKVGESTDGNEKDGSSGESATQGPRVYRMALGNQILRLIDTPGMGDTRGIAQDQKNMERILATVGGYNHIHGILVLLKPNMSRLTLMFRFCVNELLSHLHKDAARNTVFGFTNTRQTNYMPGDSFKPLETLLRKHKSVDIQLGRKTVFCFDSESFRFLATWKNIGVVMDNIDDFRVSWDRSVLESRRLINCFEAMTPHATKSTLSLNAVRQLIIGLTRPIADISSSIKSTVRLNTETLKDLQNAQCRGEDLRSKLHFDKVNIEIRPLDQPRTVCRNRSCVEYKDIGGSELRPIYKKPCHDGCTVRGVKVDVVGDPRVGRCRAFSHGRAQNCVFCTHHWQEHLHFLWEQHETIVQETDLGIDAQLRQNASDVELKEKAIETLKMKLSEAEQEYNKIQDAAVQFGLYLKHHSIAAYNDDMLAYLDELIKDQRQTLAHAEETGTSEATNSQAHLDELLKMKAEYQERIEILKKQMTSDGTSALLDEQQIDNLVKELYDMKLFGGNLRRINTVLDDARNATSCEENWRGSVSAGWFQNSIERISSTVSQLSRSLGFSQREASHPPRPSNLNRPPYYPNMRDGCNARDPIDLTEPEPPRRLGFFYGLRREAPRRGHARGSSLPQANRGVHGFQNSTPLHQPRQPRSPRLNLRSRFNSRSRGGRTHAPSRAMNRETSPLRQSRSSSANHSYDLRERPTKRQKHNLSAADVPQIKDESN